MTKTLYHGSHDRHLSEVADSGLFGGVFAGSDLRVAESHGQHVYEIEIDDDAICTTQYLNYHADPDAVSAAIEAEGLDADYAWEHVIDEKPCDDADEDWEMQRVRGCVASSLGFGAVEMSDEHGTSWLVLPGAELKKL